MILCVVLDCVSLSFPLTISSSDILNGGATAFIHSIKRLMGHLERRLALCVPFPLGFNHIPIDRPASCKHLYYLITCVDLVHDLQALHLQAFPVLQCDVSLDQCSDNLDT